MSVLDHLIHVNNGPSLVVCSPGKMCVYLAQSTEGQPRIKEAGGGLPGRGLGAAWEEMWAGCCGRSCRAARGQHGSILHLEKEERQMEEADEHNFTSFPEPSLGRVMDDFLSSFVFLEQQLNRNLPTETRSRKLEVCGPYVACRTFLFLGLHSFVVLFNLRCYLYIIKLTHFKCRVWSVLVMLCNCVTTTAHQGIDQFSHSEKFPLVPLDSIPLPHPCPWRPPICFLTIEFFLF